MTDSMIATPQAHTLPDALRQLLDEPALQQILGLPEELVSQLSLWGIYPNPKEPAYFMVRLSLDLGEISQEQWAALCKLSAAHCRETVDVTTRSDVILRGIHTTQLRGLMEQLAELGLIRKGAGGAVLRSIVSCPLVGVGKDEELDVTSVVHSLRAALDSDAQPFPASLKIGVFGHTDGCCLTAGQDIALSVGYAAIHGEPTLGFRLWVMDQDLGIWIETENVSRTLKILVDAWIDYARTQEGDCAFADAVVAIGFDGLREKIEALSDEALIPVQVLAEDEVFEQNDHIGVAAQKEPGMYSIGVPVVVGRLSSEQMKKIADMCKRYGEEIQIRLTLKQKLMLLNIREEYVQKFLVGLRDVGLSINANPIRRGWLTCTGSEFSHPAQMQVRERARHFVEHLENRIRLDYPIRMHMDGCVEGAARSSDADIHLIGQRTIKDGQKIEAYSVMVRGHVLVEALAVTDCLKRLELLLKRYQRKAQPFESFARWADRLGEKKLLKIVEEEVSHPLDQD